MKYNKNLLNFLNLNFKINNKIKIKNVLAIPDL